MDLLRLFRNGDGSTRRIPAHRRPTVEALEGRQLLSGIRGHDIGVAEVQKVREAVQKVQEYGPSAVPAKIDHGSVKLHRNSVTVADFCKTDKGKIEVYL